MSEEKREPLLSDYDSILADEDTDSDGWRSHYEKSAMDKLQAFYENLIDTGVLMVVKEAELAWSEWDDPICGNCGSVVNPAGGDVFCAKCAYRITTAPASPSGSHPK